jgi:hypothetical protein
MKKSQDDAFVFNGKSLNPLPIHQIQDNKLGRTYNEALNNLIENYPEIIPGNQISPNSKNPPEFCHLAKNIKIGNFRLDHLLVDQFGVLTQIITLPDKNQLNHITIGKMIDFLSNIKILWEKGDLLKRISNSWKKSGKILLVSLQNQFSSIIIDDQFFNNIVTNSRSGKIRILVVSNFINHDLKRMIEFLNVQFKSSQFFGLEIKFYGNDSSEMIMVPKLFGHTQANIVHQSEEITPEYKWNKDDILNKIQNISNKFLKSKLHKVFKFAETNNCLTNGNKNNISESFSLLGRSNEKLLTFYLSGKISFYMIQINHLAGIKRQDKFLNLLKKLELINNDLDINKISKTPYLNKNLSQITNEKLKIIFHGLKEYYSVD